MIRIMRTVSLIITDDKMAGRRILLAPLLIPWAMLLLALGLLLIEPIGCSHYHPSPAESEGDHCRTCARGDDSSCRLVTGIFTRPQLNVGYNVIASLPRGACNLNISEVRLSPNHLSLRRPDGSYIFNGDWRLSPSGSYQASSQVGGPMLRYKRQDLRNYSMESITSQGGPLPEPLELVVLYQQPNPGIRYEYRLILPSNTNLQPQTLALAAATSRTASYAAAAPKDTTDKGSSSSSLQQLPPPILKLYNTVATFPARNHNPPLELTNNAADTLQPYQRHIHSTRHHHHRHLQGGNDLDKKPIPEKKFQWKVIGYTNCSEPCGGGIQRSILRCVRSPSGIPVPDRRCYSQSQQQEDDDDENNKPHSPQTLLRCNLKPCPAEWVTEDWSEECEGVCGRGERRRPVHCQQKISPTLTMRVAEGACLQPRPEDKMGCELLRSCTQWRASEWGECSTKCGNGIRRRNVTCVGINGEEGDVGQCEIGERPAEIRACNMGPCEGVNWFVSEWGEECTEGCGRGVQTRHVVCSSNRSNPSGGGRRRSEQYYTYQHNHTLRRNETEPEEDNLVEHLVGLDDDKVEDQSSGGSDDEHDHFCEEDQKPPEERECFSERRCSQPIWFTGDWGNCSASCGSGIRTRQVLCIIFLRGRFKILAKSIKDAFYCPSHTRPHDREACSNQDKLACDADDDPRWFTSEWGDCSALCGGGLQKRSVSCRSSGENWRKASSLCEDEERPIERRSCNEFKCNSSSNLPPSTSTTQPSPQSSSSSSANEVQVKHQPPSRISVKSSDHHHNNAAVIDPDIDAAETDDADECPDEYRNCALVVQARLCRYKYYRTVCCHSCSDAPL